MKKYKAIRQLDQLIKQPVSKTPVFQSGWVRTIRKSLGMTIKQLASKMGLSSSRIVKIEMDETEGGVTLHTLKKTADALNCHLVYAFIPKQSTFQAMIDKQVQVVAQRQIHTINHSMGLEDQRVKDIKEQEKEVADELLRQSWKHLWSEDEV